MYKLTNLIGSKHVADVLHALRIRKRSFTFNGHNGKSKDVSQTAVKEKIANRSDQVKTASQDGKQGYIIDTALPKTYSPAFTEAAWYTWWEENNFFSSDYSSSTKADREERKTFVTCLPPPNITGSLHLGHALGTSIQDAIVRWHRMSGSEVLWNPGCDHAGIATQAVVEKKLWKEQKKRRSDLDREAFVQEVWKWKQQKGVEIYSQMKSLGLSLDWTRAVFTLDPKLSYAVTEAFIRLHDEGLLYRSKRMINWSCALNSTISDIEVDNLLIDKKTFLEVPGYQKKIPFGVMTYFAYPVQDSDEELVVATTRPETMLGDTAVAVHPEDSRYTHLHGKLVRHPFYADRFLPIVCDTFVEQNKGTGAVKITPCHDADDYAVGIRHGLQFIDIIDDSGNLTNVPEKYKGMKRFEARKKVVYELKSFGLFKEEKDHVMSIPFCSRSGDIIEPRLKDQWFLDCKDMANQAIQAVKNKELEIVPPQYKDQWHKWLEDSRDWCLSRQLWWGHRVPAYKVEMISEFQQKQSHPPRHNTELWVSAHTREEAVEKAMEKYQLKEGEFHVTQDEDVLDTWFSSALFPFSIFGWPEKNAELSRFYPTQLLETGSDIMFFWVARMVMLGKKLTGIVPFNQVLFHSILRDAHGRKMSKSLGNVIDPMDVITGKSLKDLNLSLEKGNLTEKEVAKAKAGQRKDFPQGIPECGADALRFTMCSYNYKAYYSNVNVNDIKTNRAFCNKIWQSFRFIMGELETFTPPNLDASYDPKTYEHASSTDLWLLSRLSHVVSICDNSFHNYSLNEAARALFHFWRENFCDVYLEYSKRALKEDHVTSYVLYLTLHTGLRLLSPFMPYITEELFQRLPRTDDIISICVAPYPKPAQYPWRDTTLEEDFTVVEKIFSQVLSFRRDFNLTKAKPPVFIKTNNPVIIRAVEPFQLTLEVMSRSNCATLLTLSEPDPEGCVKAEVDDLDCTVYMQIKDHIDPETTIQFLHKQKLKREDEIVAIRKLIEKLQAQVGKDAETFLDLLSSKQKQLKATQSEFERINNALTVINNLKI